MRPGLVPCTHSASGSLGARGTKHPPRRWRRAKAGPNHAARAVGAWPPRLANVRNTRLAAPGRVRSLRAPGAPGSGTRVPTRAP
eukprot:3197775-Prymnesium_polylepis.1